MQKVLEIMAQRQKDNLAFNIVALGDSVTNGVFDCTFDIEKAWPARLKMLLNGIFPALRINIINSGISGDSTEGAYRRMERDVFAYNPDLVIVCLGLNNMDTPIESIKQVFASIFSDLTAKNIPSVYLTPNMVNCYTDEKEIRRLFDAQWAVDYAQKLASKQTGGEVDGIFTAAAQAARDNGAVICDAYSAWKNLYNAGVDTTKLLSNRINHPTREMHALFASMLLNTILSAER